MAHPPVNKGMSSIPTALHIFFLLPEVRVHLPGLDWLQHRYPRKIDAQPTDTDDSVVKARAGGQGRVEVGRGGGNGDIFKNKSKRNF